MIDSSPVVRNYGYDAYEPGTLDFRQGIASSVQTGPGFFGEDGLGFQDILDAINPLQHLPLVGAIYRSLTGDQISTGARLIGGALFAGPMGFAAALFDSAVADATGQDLGGTALAWILGGTEGTQTAARTETTSSIAGPARLAPPDPRSSAVPQLSPEAFDALMRSVSQQPETPPAPSKEEIRDAALALRDLLRRHAQAPEAAR